MSFEYRRGGGSSDDDDDERSGLGGSIPGAPSGGSSSDGDDSDSGGSSSSSTSPTSGSGSSGSSNFDGGGSSSTTTPTSGGDDDGTSNFDNTSSETSTTGGTSTDDQLTSGGSGGPSSGPEPEPDTSQDTTTPTRGGPSGSSTVDSGGQDGPSGDTVTPTRGETGSGGVQGDVTRRDRQEFEDAIDAPQPIGPDVLTPEQRSQVKSEIAADSQFSADELVVTGLEDGQAEARLTVDARKRRARTSAADELDERTPLTDVTAEDIVFNGTQAELDTQSRADVARERTAAQSNDIAPTDVDLTSTGGGGFVTSVERQQDGAELAPGPDPNVSPNTGRDNGEISDSQRADFREEAADEFGVAPEDVEVTEDDGTLRAEPIGTEGQRFLDGLTGGFAGDAIDSGQELAREATETAATGALVPAAVTAGAVGTATDRLGVDAPDVDAPTIGAAANAPLTPTGVSFNDLRDGVGVVQSEVPTVDDAANAPLTPTGVSFNDLQEGNEEVNATGRAVGFARTSPLTPGGVAFEDLEAGANEVEAPDVETVEGRAAGEAINDAGSTFIDRGRAGLFPLGSTATATDAAVEAGGIQADTEEVDFDTEDALALGAAGVAAPEPTTSVGGAVLAGGALIGLGLAEIDRRNEIDAPTEPESIQREIDAPENREPTVGSEIGAPESREPTINSEINAPESREPTLATEIDAPADGEPTLGSEVDTPTIDAAGVGVGESPAETPFNPTNTPEIGPVIEDPLEETDEGPNGTVVDRDPVRFPGDSAESAGEVETPTSDLPDVTEPLLGTGTGSSATQPQRGGITQPFGESGMGVGFGPGVAFGPESGTQSQTSFGLQPANATATSSAAQQASQLQAQTTTSLIQQPVQGFAPGFGAGTGRPPRRPRRPRFDSEDGDTFGEDSSAQSSSQNSGEAALAIGFGAETFTAFASGAFGERELASDINEPSLSGELPTETLANPGVDEEDDVAAVDRLFFGNVTGGGGL